MPCSSAHTQCNQTAGHFLGAQPAVNSLTGHSGISYLSYSCPAGACACGRPVALPRLLASVTSVSRPSLLCPSRSSSKEMAPAPNIVTMMLPPYANTATSSPWQQQAAGRAHTQHTLCKSPHNCPHGLSLQLHAYVSQPSMLAYYGDVYPAVAHAVSAFCAGG
jgi:hypothetical protein